MVGPNASFVGNGCSRLANRGHGVSNLDLRGHGDSGHSADGTYTVDSFCGDLHVAIAANTVKPVLIGASLGGLISLTVAGESKNAISEGLVLVDVTPTVDPEGRAKIDAFVRERPEGFVSLEEAADVIAQFLPDRPRPKDLAGLRRNLRLRTDGRWIWHWDPAFLDTQQANSLYRGVCLQAWSMRQLRFPTRILDSVRLSEATGRVQSRK
jgi:pimeloyl-ACP methyl ester carboxylesterase